MMVNEGKLVFSLLSPFHTAWIPCQGTVLPTMQIRIPTAINIIKIISHRHDQRPISQIIPDPTKLTITANHHTYCDS